MKAFMIFVGVVSWLLGTLSVLALGNLPAIVAVPVAGFFFLNGTVALGAAGIINTIKPEAV